MLWLITLAVQIWGRTTSMCRPAMLNGPGPLAPARSNSAAILPARPCSTPRLAAAAMIQDWPCQATAWSGVASGLGRVPFRTASL